MIALLKNLVLGANSVSKDFESNLALPAARALKIPVESVKGWEILHSAVDSRRGEPRLIYTLKLELDDCAAKKVAVATTEELAAFNIGCLDLPDNSALCNPIVVGTGPAGIFGALALALAGAKPLIIDRGSPVDLRTEEWHKFLTTRELDEESNLLIGEGGAGTFSDGKLYTGTRDGKAGFVKAALVQAGAPAEILWRSRPHIGSDYLRTVAAGLRKRIEDAGGVFRFHTNVQSLHIANGRCAGVVTGDGEILSAPAVLLAPGLGGRNLIRNILAHVNWELKPFQMGCRIEHPQNFIDITQYHGPRPVVLGAAEYHLVSRRGERHVSSFCMCPGGVVVNASAWKGRSCSNGMSEFSRGGEFANSCLICTINPGELGNLISVDENIETIDRRIYQRGGSDYTMPAQRAVDFIAGRRGNPIIKSGSVTGSISSRLDDIPPLPVRNAIVTALHEFEHRCSGFIRNGVFIGFESCVSSPIRILRDNCCCSSLPGLYPAGEGVGMAGGIMSAACDGIRTAEFMLKM